MKNRNYIIFYLLFFIICFCIPIFFTNIFSNSNIKETNSIQKEEKIQPYNYKKYNKIKLLHTKTKKIEEMALDEYICGVVSAEMPASFEDEALKAQAVVARTYTLYKILNNKKTHKNANICDSFKCCQAWISKKDRIAKWNKDKKEEYWNKIVKAVDETRGKIITYNGKPINAFFHSNSGGNTESPVNVWGGNYPYLQSVQTSGEEEYSQYASEVIVTEEEFEENIKKVHNNFKIDFKEKDCIEVKQYTEGNRVKTIKIGNLELSGVEIRIIFKLKSANFKIIMQDKKIKFEVIGYGHGVGMSQTGANSLAKQGKNYKEIIKHFYKNVLIKDI